MKASARIVNLALLALGAWADIAAGADSPVTFNKHLAPVLFGQCAICHRPGGSGPFNLLTYADARKHSDDMVQVTARRYMPPWLPEHGFGDFVGERRLSDEQILLFRRWRDGGMAEGARADLPPEPKWQDGWQLGRPDLIVEMPRAYTLSGEGRDVYRNFVVPAALPSLKFVRAVEFRPGPTKAIHHAFIKVDVTGQSRKLESSEPVPGFPGMSAPGAEMPEGQFLGWQPGRFAAESAPGLPWFLPAGSDLVFQLHMNPVGHPEEIRCTAGIYFSERPPTHPTFKILLTSLDIDLPAGSTNGVVADEFTLPVDAEVLAVLPHAHYLAREMRGLATLPDGTQKSLLWIRNWDFNWQGDYRYRQPIFLPRGTRLSMRFTYDNSSGNPRNPHSPPQRVVYGPQSSDEMGELWFQIMLRNREDVPLLGQEYDRKMKRVFVTYNESLLRKNSGDIEALTNLGKSRLAGGDIAAALTNFQKAIELRPDFDEAHYFSGLVFRMQGKLDEAKREFTRTIELNPKNGKAFGNLGVIFMEEGRLDEAESRLKSALQLNPSDEIAQTCLKQIASLRAARPKP